jgi:DNA-binding transcriptional ArsR family regulator
MVPLDWNEWGQPITEIDRVIHEPARLLILGFLSVIESADFLFLMRQTELTRGNLSSHLSKLEAAGYVNIKKEFVKKIPRTLIRITGPGRKALQDYKTSMMQVLKEMPKPKSKK